MASAMESDSGGGSGGADAQPPLAEVDGGLARVTRQEKENGEESKTARHLPWGGGDRSRLARRLLAFLPLPRRMAASFLAGRMRNGGGVCPTGEGESSVRAGTRWWVWTRAVRAKAARTEGLLGVTVICSGFRSMAGVYVLIGVVSGAAG